MWNRFATLCTGFAAGGVVTTTAFTTAYINSVYNDNNDNNGDSSCRWWSSLCHLWRHSNVIFAEEAVIPPHSVSEIMRFGYPGTEQIRARPGHVVSYSRRMKTANWVCEHLSEDRINSRIANRKNSTFMEDKMDTDIHRAKLTDYLRSGFDRGHLAAAGNHSYAQDAMDSTFFLSNMSPQVGKGFNRDKWAHLENHCRQLTKDYANVWVITGPLYLSHRGTDGLKYVRYQVIGNSEVAVPTHFFKAVLVERRGSGELVLDAFVLPNEAIPDKTPLRHFRVPLQQIEAASGYNLFERVNDRYKRIEALV